MYTDVSGHTYITTFVHTVDSITDSPPQQLQHTATYRFTAKLCSCITMYTVDNNMQHDTNIGYIDHTQHMDVTDNVKKPQKITHG